MTEKKRVLGRNHGRRGGAQNNQKTKTPGTRTWGFLGGEKPRKKHQGRGTKRNSAAVQRKSLSS